MATCSFSSVWDTSNDSSKTLNLNNYNFHANTIGDLFTLKGHIVIPLVPPSGLIKR